MPLTFPRPPHWQGNEHAVADGSELSRHRDSSVFPRVSDAFIPAPHLVASRERSDLAEARVWTSLLRASRTGCKVGSTGCPLGAKSRRACAISALTSKPHGFG